MVYDKDSRIHPLEAETSGTDASGTVAASPIPVAVAPEIAGYEILNPLGFGVMGNVWSARFLALNQLRAVKVLSKELVESPGFLERFAQEAKALERLEHPNIVKVYDANAEHDPPYIAMEWVDGEPLSQILAKQPVPRSIAVAWLLEIAEALDYAHGVGFVHGDIKPSNVMISSEDRAMLIDFGLTGLDSTPYLPPEVCESQAPSSAGDIWSLAVLIYRSLVRELPFVGDTNEVTRKKIVSDSPIPPKELGMRLRRFLVYVLAKDPSKRYKSAVRMIQDLRKITNPLSRKVERETTSLVGAFALFGGGGAILVALLCTFAFTAFHHRQREPLQVRSPAKVAGAAQKLLSPGQPNGASVAGPASEPGTSDANGGWLTTAAAGYTLSLPPGWTSSDASNGSQQITSYSAPGRPDVVLRVISEPLEQDGTLDGLFGNRESAMQAQGGYERLNFDEHSTFAGHDAVSWEFVQQGAVSNSHCLAFGLLRSGGSLTVESWCPVDEESTWSPVFDRIHASFVLNE